MAIEVMNRLRAWVPTLVALSANSPYWMGRDSAYHSFRTQIFHRWPTAGIPEHLDGRADYDHTLDLLLRTGAIDSPARIYWDIRPSHRYPTLEFRATDVAVTVEESVCLAAVIRALVETAHREAVAGVTYDPPRPELLRAALWRASRFGLSGRLVDVPALQERPADDVLAGLLAKIGPVLRDRGELDRVTDGLEALRRVGTGAERQRRAVAREHDLVAAVDAATL